MAAASPSAQRAPASLKGTPATPDAQGPEAPRRPPPVVGEGVGEAIVKVEDKAKAIGEAQVEP